MIPRNRTFMYLVALSLLAIGGVIIGLVVTDPFGSANASPFNPETSTLQNNTGFQAQSQEIDMPDSLIEPDPDFEDKLRQARISTNGWKTDFSRHSVSFSEIFSGGVPRDGIPPLDDPRFASVKEANEWLGDQEPVIALQINGEARAYPLQILTWHEIANDVVGGVPVVVTFCPLCNSTVVFDRRLDGTVYDFGVSGNLRNSDLIMWDRQTESWWQQRLVMASWDN